MSRIGVEKSAYRKQSARLAAAARPMAKRTSAARRTATSTSALASARRSVACPSAACSWPAAAISETRSALLLAYEAMCGLLGDLVGAAHWGGAVDRGIGL